MFTVWVQVDVLPGRIDEFLAAILDNAKASVEDEPGCIRFDVHRDAERPHRFYFYEDYVDESAFRDGHCHSAHFRRYAAIEAACVVDGSKELRFSSPVARTDR